MNQHPSDSWRGPGGPPPSDAQAPPRPFGGFGAPPGPQGPSHVLPPPSASYHQHHSQPSGGHGLSISELTQGPRHHHDDRQSQQSGHIPPLGHGPLGQHSPPYLSRDRDDRRERDFRDQQMRDRDRDRELQQRHREDMLAQERQERLQREQEPPRPVQSHAGSIPLHQPVASKLHSIVNGGHNPLPNDVGGPPINGPGSGGSRSIFGTAPVDQRPPFGQQQPPIMGGPSQQAPAFIGGPSPLPAAAQLSHGQQPILNDALSYLDQVKVRFNEQPDVYNRFLDIMKDFKSQAIDTPGVIERVSNLFNGHPALIQGFNTFLPPGYRIECGTADNPDAIRVTTPSGTMTQSLQGARGGQTILEPANLVSQQRSGFGQQDPFDERRQGWSQAPEDSLLHQQDQRGVTSLQNAANASSNAARAVSPTGSQQISGFGADAKRGGPVEFNHAISYVNKIKNRFNSQPEIYKQFLEILQTYQREAKPIHDVYAQVTSLFHSAPDLLEDFKQFLPDTTGQAKAQASSRVALAEETSNMRGEPGYTAQAQTPRPAAKMPPMGQFDPPSTSKDNKKRRGGPSGQNGPSATDAATGTGRMPVQVGNTNKRQKIANQRQPPVEQVVTSPSLTPALPEPMPPFPNLNGTIEEIGFFERVKKQISNRATYSEFLKLVNLYANDVIDKYTLSDRVQGFLGPNHDLEAYFKDFLGIEDVDATYEAKPRIDSGRVNLSHCRSLGPSYRHLPKRDQEKPCKGRDGMCFEVLNDVWASHPTWASEDSGFVAHRKNQHEEALHRIEEERHDYDFHIESCQRTIQLMEPLVTQFRVMTDAERDAYRLQQGFGSASASIPKRIIMKVYGREVGSRILTELYNKPLSVMPIVLNRLKQKLEEWKSTQREWEKVWRDSINKQFWKSLDHQGINIRTSDKKAFQQKQLITDIQNKYEEAKKKRENGETAKRYHLEYKFEDVEVIVDTTRLMLVTLAHDRNDRNGFTQSDQDRVRAWILDFVPRFFGLNSEEFAESMRFEVSDPIVDQDGNDSDEAGPRRGRKMPLFRRIFDKRNGNTDSAMNSKESTPLPTTEHDMDVDEEPASEDTEEERPLPVWINLTYAPGGTPQERVPLEEVYDHTTFNLYANANIYCFFRMFEMLYSRLLGIKNSESHVREAIRRQIGSEERKKVAVELRMIDKGPEYFFGSLKATSSHHYYYEMIQMIGELMQGTTEMSHLEETLRRYYNKTGWQLYTVDKLLTHLLRFVANILLGDFKDKSVDITNLFFKDRERAESTRRQELEYRKQVQNMSKDKEGETYAISYTPDDKICTIRYFPKEAPTFDSDALTDDQLWQYYVASYAMREPTEGIDLNAMRKVHLQRNIPLQPANLDQAVREAILNSVSNDDQTAFISPDNYKLLLNARHVWHREPLPEGGKSFSVVGRVSGSKKFRKGFNEEPAWMQDADEGAVGAKKDAWSQGLESGFRDAQDDAADEMM